MYPDTDGVSTPTDTPLYYRIPLDVAHDRFVVNGQKLSDGAVLLFGEIFGIVAKYGKCIASDAHFMARRGRSRATIQRQLGELEARGHIKIVTADHTNRTIMVPERFLGGKDKDGTCLKNETPSVPKNEIGPKGETGGVSFSEAGYRKSEQRKTQESKNPESKNSESKTTPESYRAVSFLQLSREEQEKAAETVRKLEDQANLKVYHSLMIQAHERNRLDAWDAALAQTLKRKQTSGDGLEHAPIAYFRTVLKECFDLDRHHLARRGQRPSSPKSPAAPMKDDDEESDGWNDDGEGGDAWNDYDAQEDAWERHEAAKKAAYNTPVTPAVQAMIDGVGKSMPKSEQVEEGHSVSYQHPSAKDPKVTTGDSSPKVVVSPEIMTRYQSLSAYDKSGVNEIRKSLALEADPNTAKLMTHDPRRINLMNTVLGQALEKWDAERASKKPLLSREELRAKNRSELAERDIIPDADQSKRRV